VHCTGAAVQTAAVVCSTYAENLYIRVAQRRASGPSLACKTTHAADRPAVHDALSNRPPDYCSCENYVCMMGSIVPHASTSDPRRVAVRDITRLSTRALRTCHWAQLDRCQICSRAMT
jgi:hypothetical protein